MNFPPPSEKQARVLWFSITSLAIVMLLALLGVVFWGLGWVVSKLSSVLLPLAVAGVIACLLDPVVDFFEQRLKIPRLRAIIWTFFLALMVGLILLATVVPKIVYESIQLVDNLPSTVESVRLRVHDVLEQNPAGQKLREAWDTQYGLTVKAWLTKALPDAGAWLLAQLARMAGWFGLLLGLALVPIYTFFFLMEKHGIEQNWTDYLPLRESQAKQELVFLLRTFNETLITFFRGQVLVALCSGTMLALGYLGLGLNYAVLLGAVAAVLGIIPYLGSITSFSLAVIVAFLQFHDWLHPILVLALFLLVQAIEGFYTSPKIIGDRVGLHPLTVIIAVMLGTALLGGIVGGVLAIPITAALRTVMFRYVWVKRNVLVPVLLAALLLAT